MKFLVDNQLPSDLARWLRRHDEDAVHVLNRGLSDKSDVYLWQLAARESRVVISKDEDFLELANRPHDKGKLLWCRMGNFRKRDLIRRFEDSWPRILAEFQQGRRVVEIG